MFLRTPADIGAAIKDRRKRLKIGQEELGRRVGVSRQWIIAVEKGHDRAELALVLSVLNALDLRLDVHPFDATPKTASLEAAIADNARARIALTDVLKRAREIASSFEPSEDKGTR
ncbi:MAG: helix-turn-helix domain-containing protein [Asticcacaulis sp.]|uniref:helix-turn-helix domain-containing protein n=1 Tax=Asticcacaulis sp. TaxID=1872648 RepID=UPI0039E223FB